MYPIFSVPGEDVAGTVSRIGAALPDMARVAAATRITAFQRNRRLGANFGQVV